MCRLKIHIKNVLTLRILLNTRAGPIPLLIITLLSGLIGLMLWTFITYKNVLKGPYRLLRSDNISLECPPYKMEELPKDDQYKLINLNHFKFTMNDPSVQCNTSNKLLVLAVVHSSPKHFYKRKAIRNTWGLVFDSIFLVGETDKITQRLLQEENAKYKDIIQGSFVDSYRNMTYKHVMGLKWVTYYCRSARYILKIDDDVFVNSRNFYDLLMNQLSPTGARKLILCEVQKMSLAQRSRRSKWRVKPKEYIGRRYPSYCTGLAILYSPDVVFKLYQEAQRTAYFWIDDVHVTGTLAVQANLSLTTPMLCTYLWSTKDTLTVHKSDYIFGLTENVELNEAWETLYT